jgi:hypothetical protein
MRTRPSWNHPCDKTRLPKRRRRSGMTSRDDGPSIERLLHENWSNAPNTHGMDADAFSQTSIVLKARPRVDRNCMFPAATIMNRSQITTNKRRAGTWCDIFPSGLHLPGVQIARLVSLGSNRRPGP